MTKEIQESVCNYLARNRHESICENFGHTVFEMDIASLSKSGMLHEYEVKISRSDFLADKKKHKKYGLSKFEQYGNPMGIEVKCPNYFYYVCPEGMIKKDEIPVYAGLYYYEKEKGIRMIKNAKRIHKVPQDENWILRKMLRMNIQRKYLGGTMLTYLNRKLSEKYLEMQKSNENEINNSLFANEK